MNEVKIAIPNKGRMFEKIISLLEEAGMETSGNSAKKLFVSTSQKHVSLMFVNTQEVGYYVQEGIADIGITGYDIIMERGFDVEKLLDLPYGACRLILAGPEGKELKSGIKVATKYPRLSKKYFDEKGIDATLIESAGATEITPRIGTSDFIIDITSSGASLVDNQLVIFDELLTSTAVMVANKKALAEKAGDIGEITMSIQSILDASDKKYLMCNLKRGMLDDVVKFIPHMTAPTVVRTTDDMTVAIQTVVPKSDIMKVISQLKIAGATDILIMDIERIVK